MTKFVVCCIEVRIVK